jgi:hypothetical protein
MMTGKTTGEITLRDLIAWTDLVSPDTPDRDRNGDDPLARDVDWVVTARSTPPMLPTLRGGELVLLPERVASESALNLQFLIQELTSQPVAGVVLDTDEPVRSPIPVLRTAQIGPELESDLNRMLTTRRGDLLRSGAEIARIITEQRGLHASPEALLRSLADQLRLDFVVRTASGSQLISTGPTPSDGDPAWMAHPLSRGRSLMLGSLSAETHALGRFVLQRVAGAVQSSLDEEASAVQDHATRTRLLNQALRTASTDPQGAAGMVRRAGIQSDAMFRLVLGPAGTPEREIWPLLRSLGTPIDAGTLSSRPAWLVLDKAPAGPPRVLPAEAWIAVSAPMTRLDELAGGVRQAIFLAEARQAGTLGGPLVQFDDLVSVGVARLLFEHWGTPLLDAFVETMLGRLIREDRRGHLRATLRAYLAFGGTQRPTAEHLQIHRNTLTYRLRQIRALLSVDPDDPAARLNLHVALVASELPPPPRRT